MLTYSALVTLYLAYLGFAGGLTAVFLWPAGCFARDPINSNGTVFGS